MTPQGLAQLKQDEGCRLASYPDPLSPLAVAMRLPASERPKGWSGLSGEPYTIGYGCTGAGIGPNTSWSKAQADSELEARVADTERRLKAALPWLAQLDSVRADVLTNIAFNVGVSELLHWTTTLGHVRADEYSAAADCLLHEGKWNRDVGARADRLAYAMRVGAWS